LAADYPKAVDCLRDDLEELPNCWRYKSLAERKSCEPMVGSFQSPIPRQFMDVLRIA
jgi:hypothetical protein